MATSHDLILDTVQTIRKTILVVEDDDSIGECLVEVISQDTLYLPILATSSARALEIVQEITPDLFILDYFLGGMNGILLYDTLHAQKKLKFVPALILTASPSNIEEEVALRHIRFLKKPIELDELVQCIEQVVTT